MDTILKLTQALGIVIKEITTSKVLLLILLGIGGTLVTFTYENRQEFFAHVAASPYLLVGGTAGLLSLFLGYIFSVLVKRADERNEALFAHLLEQIAQLKAQTEDCIARERECNRNFAALLKKLKVYSDGR